MKKSVMDHANAKSKKIVQKPTDSGKEIMKQAKKLFGDSRKNISAIKKVVKSYSKLMTEALKADPKTAQRVAKLFGYINLSYDQNMSSVGLNLSKKVRVPKMKPTKVVIDSAEKNPKVKAKRKYARKAPKNETKTEVVAPTEVIDPPKIAAEVTKEIKLTEIKQQEVDEPTDAELAEVEKELEEDEDIIDEMSEHEDSSETSDEDDEEAEEDVCLRDRKESDDEMFDAMRDNGDFEE